MYKINKIDFFIGAFLSMIINSTKGVPALFDETEHSKRVEFATNTRDFNVYIKYTTRIRKSRVNIDGRRRRKMSCDISFSQREYDILENSFVKKDKQNLVCLVCTNDKLTSTYMVILSYEDAMECLKDKTNSGYRRISVTRIGAEHNYNCYGVGFGEDNSIKSPVNFVHFLGLAEDS